VKPLLDDCKWPDIQEPYLCTLKEIARYALSTYETTIGLIASGTIIRGNPDISSDFDIYVIHREEYRQRIQMFFNGIPAEIFVNPPTMIERYFKEEMASGRPVTAHMLGTGTVILQKDPIVERLRERAIELLKTPPEIPEDLTLPRYMIACLFEDAMDVSLKDETTALLIIYQAMEQMINHAFVKAGRYIPRRKNILNELRNINKELWELVDHFYRTESFRKKMRIAGSIADQVIGVRGFFEWKSNQDYNL